MPKLLQRFPSIRRIVFCSGATTARQFLRHHGAWLVAFRAVDVRVALARGAEASSKVELQFRKLLAAQAKKRRGAPAAAAAAYERPPLTLCLPESVSPAVAHVDYPGKRATWFQVAFERETVVAAAADTEGDGDDKASANTGSGSSVVVG